MGSLPRSSEPGAGQEIKELWRKGRFSGMMVSIWVKYSWVWDHAHCGTGQVWALPLLQLTQSRSEGGEWHHLSYVEHKGGHNSLITEDSPGFSLWSPCCKALLKSCTKKREIWDKWLVFITHIFYFRFYFVVFFFVYDIPGRNSSCKRAIWRSESFYNWYLNLEGESAIDRRRK